MVGCHVGLFGIRSVFLCCSAGESNVVIREVLYSGQAFPGLENVLDLRPTPPSGGTADRRELMRGDQKE